ncbi:MAG: outer membrane protein assembly factor BamA [Treponema sp.]|jgi:outer membrane protein insertion porin family|nr:outer membrane protein assembly factor BamA [Treponema sp.]
MVRFSLVALLLVCVTFFGFAGGNKETPPSGDDSVQNLPMDSLPSEWYQGKPIRDIRFNGLRNVDSVELEGIVAPFKGRLFDDDVFWELQGRLYALEYFELISPTALPADLMGNGVIIRFTVTERPIASRILFDGNRGIRNATLQDAISLKVNDVVTQIKLRIDERAIIQKYLEKGYPDVTVRSETSAGKDDSSITVTFFVEEGEMLAITDIIFEGNEAFSTRTLKGQLSLKAKAFLSDGAFQEAKLTADRLAVTQYYRDRGYIDAEVLDVVRDVQKDEKGNNNMTLTFKINEGKSYTFSGITFEGNRLFSTEELSALILSQPGQTVNARRLEADLQGVADLYYKNGYIFNTINRSEVKDRENETLGYTITIVERGRAHIENVIVVGNEKTKTEVILREIPLETGDVFSNVKVMDAWRNLYNLQYFSMVAPDTPEGSVDGLMDLVFAVEEQPTMNIEFGISFSGSSSPDELPISGQFKWNDRNFLGYGNQLSVELSASTVTQSISTSYTQSWLFGLPLSASFGLAFQHTQSNALIDNLAPYFNGNETYAYPDGFESYEEYRNSGMSPPSAFLMQYQQWQIAPSISSGYRFSTPLGNLGVGGGLSLGFKMNQYNEARYRPFDPALRDTNGLWIPAFAIGASVSLDQRDIYYDPSSGYYTIQRFSYHGILDIEKEQYLRSDTDAEWFVTLFDLPVSDTWNFKGVLGIHSGLSFILPNFRGYDRQSIENANRLSIDGMFTARGWSSEYSVKGLGLWENWLELRIPLVQNVLAWDFFFDAAEVVDKPENIFGTDDLGTPFIERMRFSLGGGLRFAIPQFPFRLGLAKRFKVTNGDVQWYDDPLLGLNFVLSFTISTY